MRIVLWQAGPSDATGAEVTRMLKLEPGVRLRSVYSLAEVQATLPDADGLIMSSAFYGSDVERALEAKNAPALRWLHLTTAGHDNVASERLASTITVTYSPGAGARAAAEHGMSLILAIARQLAAAWRNQARARWDYGIAPQITSLAGRTLVVAGFGHIGRAIAQLAKAFGMSVHAVTRDGSAQALADFTSPVADLDSVLTTSDFVVICLPLNSATRGLFSARRLACMPSHSALINLSRGPIVDLPALYRALALGTLRAAALDVTEPEPLPKSHPLWHSDNVILTPHLASAGQSAQDRADVCALILENARRFCRGDRLNHPVKHIHPAGRVTTSES